MFKWYICGDCAVNEEGEGEEKSLKEALKRALTELVKYENWVSDARGTGEIKYPAEVKLSFPFGSEHPKQGETITLAEVEEMTKEEGFCQFSLVERLQGWASIQTKENWDEEMADCEESLKTRCQEEADARGKPTRGWTGGSEPFIAYAVPSHKWFKAKTNKVWHAVKWHNEDKTEVASVCGTTKDPEDCHYQAEEPKKICKKCAAP